MQQPVKCTICGAEIRPGQRYCVQCGARLCPKCNVPVPAGYTQCPNCNYLLGAGQPGGLPHPTPSAPPVEQPEATPKPSIPQPTGTGGYVTGRKAVEPPHHGPPSAMEYGKMRQEHGMGAQPDSASEAWGTPSPAKRFPKSMVAIVLIAGIGLLASVAVAVGLFGDPIGTFQEFAAEREWPSFLSPRPEDTTPPAISTVDISEVTRTSTLVSWETDEAATSQVMTCNPDGFCSWTDPDESLVTNHSITVDDLQPGTTYHFTVISQDASQNEATAEGDFTTSTAAAADTTPPLISAVAASHTAESSATITWETNENATSQVDYGTTDAYRSRTPLEEELTTSHSITLSDLAPDTGYHFVVKSRDASGNEATSEDKTFTTAAPPPVAAEVGTEVGDRAPPFTIEDLDGKSVALSDFRGKAVMLNFWASTRHCRTEMPLVQEVYEEWADQELAVLAINVKESPEDAQKFVDAYGLTFTVLLDRYGEVADEYHVGSKPTTFFIDADGVIQDKVTRALRTQQEIESKLDSM